jgi:UDP-glucose 4-epimerase
MTEPDMMHVLVSGGAGFLGSFVADALTAAGHRVTVFDRNPSPYLSPGQHEVVGDILDENLVRGLVTDHDVVYNYAGIADLVEAGVDPVETVRVNTLGNTILLDAARKADVRRFLFASTLYVYSEAGSFYRSSKAACELIIEEYQRSFGLPYTILRYGSLYGPRASRGNWVHSVIRQSLTDSRIVRYGSGNEIREYIHVWDAAESSVDVLAPEFENSNVIIAGQQSMRVCDVLGMIREMTGNRTEIEYRNPEGSEQANLHYEITPYSFNPKIARRLVRNTYLDLGQGLLDLMNQIHESLKDPGAPPRSGGRGDEA